MDNQKFIDLCKSGVIAYYSTERGFRIKPKNVYVVWSCKTLQNNKALLSTNFGDGRYFEITYNGNKDEMYLDVYKKELNKCLTKVSEIID